MKVRDVVDRIVAACQAPPVDKPCDRLIAGDWDCEVTGVVTTFMATVDVIHDAIARGANLIIPHEPTYFTGLEPTEWLRGDKVYELKRQLIEQNGINIWRFHDHSHLARPDLIYAGLNKELGWEQFALPETPCYSIPPTTVDALAVWLKHKLGVTAVQIVGRRDARVERLALMIGGYSLGFPEQAPMELMHTQNLDVAVCGEILEWTLCAYARDAAQLGLNKAIIILGHNRTEEAGMKHLPEWLRPLLPGVPVAFSEAGEPFAYV